MASVYRRGGSYWIRFTYAGREVRRSARTSSKPVAQQFLAHVLEEHRRLDRGGRPRHAYVEMIDRFIGEYLPTLKPSTQSRYRMSMRQLHPSFGGLMIDEINKTRLSDYVTARKRGGVTNATIRRDLATLSCMFTCAITWDFCDANPVKSFGKRHLREAPPRSSYPSDEEIERLVAHASAPAGRLIRFLGDTGMRMEEVCSLEWSQVDLKRREVRLTKTKTSSPRIVPLSDQALGTIVGTPRHITSPYVFWHHNGQRFTQFSNAFRAIAVRAKVNFRCHDLRHRFASVFLQTTGDLAVLQMILGHRSITMTLRYAHLLTDNLHASIKKLGTKVGTTTPDHALETVAGR